jgi:hypothetical protein
MDTKVLLSSIEKRERRRIVKKAGTISPPSFRSLLIHGAIAGPCLTSVFLFVPFLGPTIAVLTTLLMLRLFWVSRSLRSVVWWTVGAACTLAVVGTGVSFAQTTVEFWLYILFGISMAGAVGALIGAGALLSEQLERARVACEVE